MLIHKPWSLWQTLKYVPGIIVVVSGFAVLALYSGLLWIKDSIFARPECWPNGEPITEGDRWADRAVYSDDPTLDPLVTKSSAV